MGEAGEMTATSEHGGMRCEKGVAPIWVAGWPKTYYVVDSVKSTAVALCIETQGQGFS